MGDVARLAGGVHQSTVSLALRNDPAISESTRVLIQQAAQAAGYHRDPLLDAFNTRRMSARQHRSYPVVAIIADLSSRREFEQSPFHAALWRGAVTAAESLFHKPELFFVGPGALAPARLDSILYARGIVGLVTAGFRPTTPPLGLEWSRYCGVKIECLDWPLPRFAIATDLLQGTRVALRRARLLGYNRIGLVLEPDETARNDLIRAGYLIEHPPGMKPIPPLLAPAGMGANRLKKWIQKEQIDAILSARRETGGMLAAAGLQPGRDIGWACLAVVEPHKSIAGLVTDYARAGSLAVEQVVSLARLNQRGPATSAMVTYVPSEWKDGNSLPLRLQKAALK
jgi:LacI family transcriptional regulator